jgi:nitrate reductase NapAB chaperone NapD
LLLNPLKPQVFIEVKDTGGDLSKLQEYRVKELKEKGFLVLVSEPKDYDKTVSAVHTIREFEQVLNT